MTRAIIFAIVIVTSMTTINARTVRQLNSGVPAAGQRVSASERYAEFPPILLPESAAPALPEERTRPGQSAEIVFAFVVDTLGRVEAGTVETLSAPDSAVARAARSSLSGIRYIPARLVLDVGRCVSFNGDRGHCGGVSPAIRTLRARVVLRIVASTPPP